MGAPAGLMRRPQISELIKSDRSQSGPLSRNTTFLPAFASTEAKTEPEAPAPTMTTSTFSFVISPPLFRGDMRHIGNAQSLVAFHRAVDDIDGIASQHCINQRPRRSGPVFNLVLTHPIDKLALIGDRQLREVVSEDLAASIVDRLDCRSIELRERRTDVEDAGLQKRFARRH